MQTMPNNKQIFKTILFTHHSNSDEEFFIFNRNITKKFVFKIFSKPIWLFKKSSFGKIGNFDNSFLYHLDLNDTELTNKLSITHRCIKGRCVSESFDTDLLKQNNFFLDLNFNCSDEKSKNKKLIGEKIQSPATKLILVLSFICQKKNKSLLTTLSDFLSSYDFSYNFFDELDLYNYLTFLLKLNENMEYLKLEEKDFSFFVCCCLGILKFYFYPLIKIKLNSIINRIMIQTNSTIDKLLAANESLNEFFFNGISLILNTTMSSSTEFAYFLDSTIELYRKDLIKDSFFINMNYNEYYVSKYKLKNNLDLFKSKFAQLETNEKIKITEFFIKLSPDIQDFLSLIDIFQNEAFLENSITQNWSHINRRILKLNNEAYENASDNFEDFENKIKFFGILKFEFYDYFLQACDDLPTKISIIDILIQNQEPETVVRKLNYLKLEPIHYLEVIKEIKFEIFSYNLKVNASILNEFRVKIINNLKLLHPPFTENKFLLYIHIMLSKYFFPNGEDWKGLFSEKFILRMNNTKHVELILNQVVITSLNQNNETNELKPIFVDFLFKLEKNDAKEFLNLVSNLLKFLSSNEIKKDIFKIFLEKFYQTRNNNIARIIELVNYSELINETYIDLYIENLNTKLIGDNAELIIDILANNMIHLEQEITPIKLKVLNLIFKNVKIESIKLLLFTNPSKETFWYKIVSYLALYPELKRIKKIDEFLKDLREFYYKTFLSKQFTLKEISDMGQLNKENLEVIDFYNRAIF